MRRIARPAAPAPSRRRCRRPSSRPRAGGSATAAPPAGRTGARSRRGGWDAPARARAPDTGRRRRACDGRLTPAEDRSGLRAGPESRARSRLVRACLRPAAGHRHRREGRRCARKGLRSPASRRVRCAASVERCLSSSSRRSLSSAVLSPPLLPVRSVCSWRRAGRRGRPGARRARRWRGRCASLGCCCRRPASARRRHAERGDRDEPTTASQVRSAPTASSAPAASTSCPRPARRSALRRPEAPRIGRSGWVGRSGGGGRGHAGGLPGGLQSPSSQRRNRRSASPCGARARHTANMVRDQSAPERRRVCVAHMRTEEAAVLLENKNAIIYGGARIDRRRRRARVRPRGRPRVPRRAHARDARALADESGPRGRGPTAKDDALDDTVDAHADAVAAETADRHLLRPDHAPVHPRDPARRDGRRRLHGAGRHGRAHDVPDRAGRRAPHDPAALGRDPRLRRPRRPQRPVARLLPRRDTGRVRRDRRCAATRRRAGSARIRVVTLASRGVPESLRGVRGRRPIVE